MTASDSCISPFDARSPVPVVRFEIDSQERPIPRCPELSNCGRIASPDAGLERGKGDGREGCMEFLVCRPVVEVSEVALCGLEWRDEKHVIHLGQRFSEPARERCMPCTDMGWDA